MPVKSVSLSVVSDCLQLARLLCLWNSPGKSTEVGNHSFLQGIFLTKDWTQVSCFAGRFFTI